MKACSGCAETEHSNYMQSTTMEILKKINHTPQNDHFSNKNKSKIVI